MSSTGTRGLISIHIQANCARHAVTTDWTTETKGAGAYADVNMEGS